MPCVPRGVLAILGSGETAPGMTRVHRGLLDTLTRVDAVTLDTPYGFQENVPQMTEKLVEYFQVSLQTTLAPIAFASYDQSSVVEHQLVRQRLTEATYIFAGPGSPSYALAQWQPLALEEVLADILDRGGVVCFSSAAALTLGSHTLPVYELYKAGHAPHWLTGLGLLARIGLPAVVLPHYDNAEGGNHDTSRCYVGERRYRALEQELPAGTVTLGIDEHTAVLLDLEERTLHVQGRGDAHWRCDGVDRVLANGSVTRWDELGASAADSPAPAPVHAVTVSADPLDLARRVEARVDDWESDLARLVTMAQTGGEGFIDPSPLIDEILRLRVQARADRAFAWADALRDALVGAGVEVQDTPTGSSWTLTPDS
jgi:hypothetical protein